MYYLYSFPFFRPFQSINQSYSFTPITGHWFIYNCALLKKYLCFPYAHPNITKHLVVICHWMGFIAFKVVFKFIHLKWQSNSIWFTKKQFMSCITENICWRLGKTLHTVNFSTIKAVLDTTGFPFAPISSSTLKPGYWGAKSKKIAFKRFLSESIERHKIIDLISM